jgi:hypothetical protein
MVRLIAIPAFAGIQEPEGSAVAPYSLPGAALDPAFAGTTNKEDVR